MSADRNIRSVDELLHEVDRMHREERVQRYLLVLAVLMIVAAAFGAMLGGLP